MTQSGNRNETTGRRPSSGRAPTTTAGADVTSANPFLPGAPVTASSPSTRGEEWSAPTAHGNGAARPAAAATQMVAPPPAVPVVTPTPPPTPTPEPAAARRPLRGSSARANGPRRARLQLRHINSWTVLRFSCVLSIALFFVWLITVGVLYGALDAAGVINNINDTIQTLNGPGSKAPVTAGLVFGYAALIGVINIVLFIALATIGSIVYNLCADLVGGIELTLSEREN